MNYIDIILAVIVLIAIYSGVIKGFIAGAIELLNWLGSLLICFLLYPYVSSFIEKHLISGLWAIPFAFLITIIIIRLLFFLVVDRWLAYIPPHYHISNVNRVAGFIPGIINGLVYAAIISAFLVLLPLNPRIAEEVQESKLAQNFSARLSEAGENIIPSFGEGLNKAKGHITVKPGSEKFIKLGFTLKKFKERPDLESEMLDLVNQERKKEGLNPLKADPEMRVVALKHSADMFKRGYFSHFTPEEKSPFDRMHAEKVRFLTAGENLALAQTLSLAHKGLMNSPGHRANILHKAFGRVGIGILDGGIHGLMITQNFRN